MVGETQMSDPNGRQASPPRAAVRDVGQLAHRVLTLLELQTELLQADSREGLAGSARPAAILLGGIVVGLGSVPVLLLAMAQALREWAGASWAASYFIAALVGLSIAVAAILIGGRLLRRGLAAFDRSRGELRRNLAWVKQALRQTAPVERACESIPHVSDEE